MRTCTRCLRTLTLSGFYRSRTTGEVAHGHCIECMRRRARERYYAKYDEVRAADRQRNKDPERRAMKQRSKMKSYAKEPDKPLARRALNCAIKRGEIVRQPCSACGEPNAQAHHHDYSKPFEVEWMCRTCHGKE